MATHEVVNLVKDRSDVIEVSEAVNRTKTAIVAIHRMEVAFKSDDHCAAHFVAIVQLGRHGVPNSLSNA